MWSIALPILVPGLKVNLYHESYLSPTPPEMCFLPLLNIFPVVYKAGNRHLQHLLSLAPPPSTLSESIQYFKMNMYIPALYVKHKAQCNSKARGEGRLMDRTDVEKG